MGGKSDAPEHDGNIRVSIKPLGTPSVQLGGAENDRNSPRLQNHF
jgi:hypothetical protein